MTWHTAATVAACNALGFIAWWIGYRDGRRGASKTSPAGDPSVRIAVALERIAAAQEEQVRLQASDVQLRTQTVNLMDAANGLIKIGNDRTTWFHQETAVLRGKLDALTDKVRKMEMFQ